MTIVVMIVQQLMQSEPLSCGLIPVHGKVYSTQLYVIKFVSDLLQVWFPPSIKLTVTI